MYYTKITYYIPFNLKRSYGTSDKTRARVQYTAHIPRGGVEGPAGTAKAVPLFTVVRIAVPLFKVGRTSAANVPPRMRDCSARAYSTYA